MSDLLKEVYRRERKGPNLKEVLALILTVLAVSGFTVWSFILATN